MNRYAVLVPIAILILGGTGIVSQAFAATVLTIETDSQVYDHASTITVTGSVSPVDLRGSEVTILCKSPGGAGVCGVYQLGVNSGGDFSVSINTSTFLMKKDGVYEFQANYGGLGEATVSVELTNAIETSEIGQAVETVTGTVDVTGQDSLYKLGVGQI